MDHARAATGRDAGTTTCSSIAHEFEAELEAGDSSNGPGTSAISTARPLPDPDAEGADLVLVIEVNGAGQVLERSRTRS